MRYLSIVIRHVSESKVKHNNKKFATILHSKYLLKFFFGNGSVYLESELGFGQSNIHKIGRYTKTKIKYTEQFVKKFTLFFN